MQLRYTHRAISMGLVLVTLVAATTGCFTTKAYSRADATGPIVSEHQWFAIGGLIELNKPVGSECKQLAYVESKMGAMDVVINIGLSVAGSIVASSACGAGDSSCQSTASLGGTLLPWMLGSRTVEYQCAK
jgi:hypothetical protein